ncbi:C-type mannose receptor 2-like [Syngnathus typhle]
MTKLVPVCSFHRNAQSYDFTKRKLKCYNTGWKNSFNQAQHKTGSSGVRRIVRRTTSRSWWGKSIRDSKSALLCQLQDNLMSGPALKSCHLSAKNVRKSPQLTLPFNLALLSYLIPLAFLEPRSKGLSLFGRHQDGDQVGAPPCSRHVVGRSPLCPQVTRVSLAGWSKKCGWWMDNPSDDFCYLINHNRAKTWQEARDDCVGLGGDLLSITHSDEQTFIQGLYARPLSSPTLWLGTNANITNGIEWIDGSMSTYTNLNTGRHITWGVFVGDNTDECLAFVLSFQALPEKAPVETAFPCSLPTAAGQKPIVRRSAAATSAREEEEA